MSRTILLASRHLIARCDFSSRGAVSTLAQAIPPAHVTDASSLVLAALGLVKHKPKRVWVLTTSVATAVIEMSPDRFRGLSEAELTSALAFEAESLTGIAASSCQSAVKKLGSSSHEETWWITQVERRLLAEIHAEITQQGARLDGLAHPGGISSYLEENKAQQRLEWWQDLLFISREQSWDIQPVDESASPDAILARHRRGTDTNQSCSLLSSRQFECGPPIHLLCLQDPALLQSWMLAWREVLHATAPSVPLLHSPAPVLGKSQRVMIAVVTALLVACLCIGHWWWTEKRLQQSKEEIKTLTEQAKQRSELQKSMAEVTRLRAELETSRLSQAQILTGFGALLSSISKHRPEGLVVRQLMETSAGVSQPVTKGNRGVEVTITGICTQQELAAAFSHELAEELAAAGWSVSPARTTARLAGDIPVWDYQIPLLLMGERRMEVKAP